MSQLDLLEKLNNNTDLCDNIYNILLNNINKDDYDKQDYNSQLKFRVNDIIHKLDNKTIYNNVIINPNLDLAINYLINNTFDQLLDNHIIIGLNNIIQDENICIEIIRELHNYIKNKYESNESKINIFYEKLKEIYNKLSYKLNNILILDLIKSYELSIYDLVNTKPEKLSDDFNILNKQLNKETVINMTQTPQNITTLYKCKRCGSTTCSYIEKQVRSSDEASTIFLTCAKCNHKWKD